MIGSISRLEILVLPRCQMQRGFGGDTRIEVAFANGADITDSMPTDTRKHTRKGTCRYMKGILA
jgi:hypothetical protein